MAERPTNAAEAAADKVLSAVRAALIKAAGETGFGIATIEFKKFQPKVQWTNSGREAVEETTAD